MASADELKALGNKAMADKNYDEAMYVYLSTFKNFGDRTADFP